MKTYKVNCQDAEQVTIYTVLADDEASAMKAVLEVCEHFVPTSVEEVIDNVIYVDFKKKQRVA